MTARIAVVTPARNEQGGLERLAASLSEQTIRPSSWVIVENGSTDGTLRTAEKLAESNSWIRVLALAGDGPPDRGAPVVAAFEAGIAAVEPAIEIVIKVDADVTLPARYCERIVAAFAFDSRLGIASGACHEQENSEWEQQHMTGTSVWCAARAYRRECLDLVSPFERRMGWDGIDEIRANLGCWRTAVLHDVPFWHHRPEGLRDGSSRRARAVEGDAAWFMGYRPTYLIARSLFAATRDPGALGMIEGFARAALRRDPRLTDVAVRSYLREQQRFRNLPQRFREARGERPTSSQR